MRMINFLNKSQQNHCVISVSKLLKLFDIKFNSFFLQNELSTHPDYPSLAAVVDVINVSYKIPCMPLKVPVKNLDKLPTPFLAQIKGENLNHDIFAIVINVEESLITYFSPVTKDIQNGSSEKFSEIFQGAILVVEKQESSSEVNYETNKKVQNQYLFYNLVSFLLIPLLTIGLVVFSVFDSSQIHFLYASIFVLLTLLGVIVSSLLLLFEIDQYNPIVKQICKKSAKVNCSAVLNSNASKVFGISWSILGFVLFMGTLLFLLATGLSTSSLKLSFFVFLLSSPYIIFSVIYQWKVIKQWCLLCLIVQSLLFLICVCGFLAGWYIPKSYDFVSMPNIIGITSSFAFTFIGTINLIPALQEKKENRYNKKLLKKIKQNRQIFEGLLSKQKVVEKNPDGLGIFIGNPDSQYKIIKVCNPFCGPCAKAHPQLEELISDNENISVQILFNDIEGENNIKRNPVLHFLAVAAQSNEEYTREVLSSWYGSDNKEYQSFSKKFPLSIDKENYSDQIEKMGKWADKAEVSYTPTYFVSINNDVFYQLPGLYSVTDLRSFFSF